MVQSVSWPWNKLFRCSFILTLQFPSLRFSWFILTQHVSSLFRHCFTCENTHVSCWFSLSHYRFASGNSHVSWWINLFHSGSSVGRSLNTAKLPESEQQCYNSLEKQLGLIKYTAYNSLTQQSHANTSLNVRLESSPPAPRPLIQCILIAPPTQNAQSWWRELLEFTMQVQMRLKTRWTRKRSTNVRKIKSRRCHEKWQNM